MYDVSNRDSFLHVSKWLNDIKDLADPDCAILLLANKLDVDEVDR